jgi:transposase
VARTPLDGAFLCHAESAQAALQARVTKAKAQIEALTQRGRGRQRFEDVDTLRQAVNAIVQRHRVEEFWWLRDDQQTMTRSVRAYQDRPAYVKEESQATVEGRVDEEALELAARRLGGRIYSTNQPVEQRSLEQAVLAYRSE